LRLEELNLKFQRERILKMPKCVFCGKTYEFPRGLTYIKIDGTINYLCSSKCRKNMLMKRRKVRWVIKGKKKRAQAEGITNKK
jgi:large subunit ribosomal protein L24e